MREMGWSYTDLITTPHDVVVDALRFLNTERTVANEKAEDAERRRRRG